MKVLITGGSGHIGSFTTAHLLAQGHSVRVVDRNPASELPPDAAERIGGAEYAQVDITDFAALRAQVEGMDAIVHLAAIPHPIPGKDAEIFGINVGGTFNVYQAAADLGVKRVVSASSINALGNNYGIRNIDVHYFPIDEDHPGYTTDVYSYSKQILEETAAYFWRRNGISGACLRFPFVFNPEWFAQRRWGGDRDMFRQHLLEAFEKLMALPEDARRQEVAALRARLHELRERGERGDLSEKEIHAEFRKMPHAVMFFSSNDFWTSLDVRDAAQAIGKALLADYEGSHPLWIVGSRNSAGLPSMALASLLYPDVKTWKRPVAGDESLISIDKARALIGFEPDYVMER
ncbi:MAG TPA: NAD(P)-dependent oxidoreductase [Anaerolineae bacterium]|nr:NAD(P)-dependent oxidoreductase [Anaerolineae bacterium]